MSQSLNDLLKSISISTKLTYDSICDLGLKLGSPDLPELVQDLLNKTGQSLPEGVSLLDLKNDAMLSYINNICLIILARLQQAKTDELSPVIDLKEKAIKGSIVQRVTMERGIKSLEKKLQYQLDKMIRNYNKMEKDSSEDSINKRIIEEEQEQEDDGSEDEESEEDELNYKPDTAALMGSVKTKENKDKGKEGKSEKYKPPKIAAALPPQEFRESNKSSKNSSKLQSMEEYLMETGDAPIAEASIGSTIINNGRGGVKTLRDRQKEEEIKRFEESNFTRLSSAQSKKDKHSHKRRQADTFFGEDWGIFNNKRNDVDSSTKRSKPKSAWDRAKKRRTN